MGRALTIAAGFIYIIMGMHIHRIEGFSSGHDRVKLAMCNFLGDKEELKAFCLENGFDGIDWSFDLDGLPATPRDESLWVKDMRALAPFEVRYHCPFLQLDIGHGDPGEQKRAADIFARIIRLVSKAGGRYMTIHVGLGHDTTRMLSWERTIESLRALVRYGRKHNVRLCLENLAWGWTSKPNLFEKLIRLTGAGVTFDIGHARACEAVRTQQFGCEDFVAPHMDSVCNAHVYHDEIDGLGHVPPERLSDIADRLDVLLETGCRWWTLEIRATDGLIKTKELVGRYLEAQPRESAAAGAAFSAIPL